MTAHLRHRAGRVLARLWPARESGSATVFVVGLAIVLFGATGLAIDGGRAINARSRAIDVAEQAARAGAAAINIDVLRGPTGAVVINQTLATAAATNYLNNAGYQPLDATGQGYTVAAGADQVTVTVQFRATTVMLNLLAIDSIPVRGEATAEPSTGINGGN